MYEFKELLDKIDSTQKDVQEMKDFLLGSKFDNNKGIAYILEDHDKRLTELEEHKILTKSYTDLVKVVIGILTTGLIGLIIYFIEHK